MYPYALVIWKLHPLPISFCTVIFTNIHATLFSELESFDLDIPKFPENEIVELLLHDSPKFDSILNYKILSSCIGFTLKSEKINGSLS